MTRRIVLWVALVSVSAGVALHTSLKVRAQEDRLADIHQAIAAEQERIRVLTAEWHMLKSPARLEVLANRHLEALQRIKPEQMAGLETLPTPDALATMEAASAEVPLPTPVLAARVVMPEAGSQTGEAKKQTAGVSRGVGTKAQKTGDALAALIARESAGPVMTRQGRKEGRESISDLIRREGRADAVGAERAQNQADVILASAGTMQ